VTHAAAERNFVLFELHSGTAAITKAASCECSLHFCGRDWDSCGQTLKNGD
jgi:hypothetical protein